MRVDSELRGRTDGLSSTDEDLVYDRVSCSLDVFDGNRSAAREIEPGVGIHCGVKYSCAAANDGFVMGPRESKPRRHVREFGENQASAENIAADKREVGAESRWRHALVWVAGAWPDDCRNAIDDIQVCDSIPVVIPIRRNLIA